MLAKWALSERCPLGAQMDTFQQVTVISKDAAAVGGSRAVSQRNDGLSKRHLCPVYW